MSGSRHRTASWHISSVKVATEYKTLSVMVGLSCALVVFGSSVKKPRTIFSFSLRPLVDWNCTRFYEF